jgi:hypothetical protein
MSLSFRIFAVLSLLLVGGAVLAARLTWTKDPLYTYKAVTMRYGAKMVDDPAASTGKALCIPYQPGTRGHSVEMQTPEIVLQGKNLVTFYLRGDGMLPISDGVHVTLIAHDKNTGGWAYSAGSMIYGINLKETGYTAVNFLLPTSNVPTVYRASAILLTWQVSTPNVNAALYADHVEIRSQVLDAPLLTDVTPAKARFLPGEKATARITVENPTATDAALTLAGEDAWGLTGKRKAFTLPVTLKAGETKTLTAEWTLGSEEYGHDLNVSLLQGDKVVDAQTEPFAVCKTPMWLSISNTYDVSNPPGDLHSIFYVSPCTVQDSIRSIRFFRKQSPGLEYQEYFSWAPGDIADLAPAEEPFPGGEGRMAYRSKALIQQQLVLMKNAGMWPLSYVNGTAWADAGYKLFARHPDWFLYDANGEVGHYEMDRREIYKHKDDAAFDPNTYPMIYFQGTLNHAMPEVQEYIAKQYIRCAKEMGFKGVRMDVRYLEVHPGERNFAGKEVATTNEEADKISVAAIKRIKELVHKEVPDFTFGYNYASPEETKDMPLTMQERCAGAGWMLDEVSCGYQEKTSPYHIWSAYARRMTSWGDQVNKWGGIYNPFDFHRNGTKYPVDNYYSTIFRLIAGGRFPCYYNSRLPVGNLGRLATRYSEYFYGRNRSWLPKIAGEVDVKAPAPLWWKDMVYWNRDVDGNRQLLVHLVNPPRAAEVEENPRNEVMPPVKNIEVTAGPAPDGKLAKAAYLVTAEPIEATGEPAVQQIKLALKSVPGGKVAVTVPSVVFYKLIVFQY